jgi:1-acyl-sn-glycerol-3-phosphate acyltransferase
MESSFFPNSASAWKDCNPSLAYFINLCLIVFVIAANKSILLDSLLYIYFRAMFRSSFHTVAAHGLDKLKNLPKSSPVILYCNHTNWWDGLVVFMLTRAMPHKSTYCMMEEKQLKEYRFFTWLGAFSVDLASPIRALASIRYALRLLENNDTALWIFPQGKIVPPSEAIEVRPGTDYLAKRVPHAILVPVAFRYEFFREDRPNALIWIGDPFPAKDCSLAKITETCQESFSLLSEAAKKQDLTVFKYIFSPKLPINKKWQWVKMAVSGRLHKFNPAN